MLINCHQSIVYGNFYLLLNRILTSYLCPTEEEQVPFLCNNNHNNHLFWESKSCCLKSVVVGLISAGARSYDVEKTRRHSCPNESLSLDTPQQNIFQSGQTWTSLTHISESSTCSSTAILCHQVRMWSAITSLLKVCDFLCLVTSHVGVST